MPRGRKPISNNLKEFRGTLKNYRIKTGLTGQVMDQAPAPPRWLGNRAKAIFKEVCQVMIFKKRLTFEDLPLIAAYANEFATYQAATDKLKDPANLVQVTATGYEQISPWVTVKNQALKYMQSLGAVLGLDPVARLRLNEKIETESEFQKLMREIDEIEDDGQEPARSIENVKSEN